MIQYNYMKNNQEILQKLTKTETEILQLYKHNTECKSSENIDKIL